MSGARSPVSARSVRYTTAQADCHCVSSRRRMLRRLGRGSAVRTTSVSTTGSTMADAHLRVEEPVADVDEEAHHDLTDDEHEGQPLDHGKIRHGDRSEHQGSEARDGEDLLDDDRAAEEVPELQPENGERGYG